MTYILVFLNILSENACLKSFNDRHIAASFTEICEKISDKINKKAVEAYFSPFFSHCINDWRKITRFSFLSTCEDSKKIYRRTLLINMISTTFLELWTTDVEDLQLINAMIDIKKKKNINTLYLLIFLLKISQTRDST